MEASRIRGERWEVVQVAGSPLRCAACLGSDQGGWESGRTMNLEPEHMSLSPVTVGILCNFCEPQFSHV